MQTHVFSVLSRRERQGFVSRYLSFLQARDGTPDFDADYPEMEPRFGRRLLDEILSPQL